MIRVLLSENESRRDFLTLPSKHHRTSRRRNRLEDDLLLEVVPKRKRGVVAKAAAAAPTDGQAAAAAVETNTDTSLEHFIPMSKVLGEYTSDDGGVTSAKDEQENVLAKGATRTRTRSRSDGGDTQQVSLFHFKR